MAYSILMLLLMGVISSYLPRVQARPQDFWRGPQAKTHMKRTIEELTVLTTQAACVGSDMLPTPVQIPCVFVNTTEWENKTLQQKCAEVVSTFQVFQHGVQGAKNGTTSKCQISFLEQLEHRILNYLAILNRLQIQTDTVTSSHPAVQSCSSQTHSVKGVLKQFEKLLKGKLSRLTDDLKDNTKSERQGNQNQGT
ncbi:uncharacterized protein LOC131969644 isoform X2 [Centropristis striata]|uniref:uncharacterized protein LOC131969644 isoform X2 n=1 Tax=Centropristis striata TaxID=184440 RepID=UPI0027E05BAB|nr:uncharacterized protein LOC131969644 isoform X2 [Centropristis striata]